ncbi:hypothetical protein G6O69_13065 [Pseudenhygromyxa sp. WMMC2535]|uniref:hypothetical protein n=1 Tax=Pseudenhygromyxa sp. WMMC2535 TaxID=2712867 RepID=UPI00159615A6|nr:hypothetical protein [Pseudenhygromyxa sp. WMMC2535]NVB38764.1 hypothetical protein [Pseudenhygromyxa sp. WMMC2535]
MVTSVGYDAPATCAAIRCGLNRFEETRFRFGGEWVIGASIPLPGSPRGIERLLTMAATPIEECLGQLPAGEARDTAWVVCLSETDRPGRPAGLDEAFAVELRTLLVGAERLGQHSQLLTGVLSPVRGLLWLDEVIASKRAKYGILAAADGFLHAATLEGLDDRGAPLSTVDGGDLVPGEAGGAIAVASPRETSGELQCLGIGWGHELAVPGSGQPLRGEGLAAACRGALESSGVADNGCGLRNIDYRIADLGGDRRQGFREAALAQARVMRVRKAELDLWLPSESLGHVGAGATPISLGLALDASRRGYAPGSGVLMQFGADDGGRAAVVLREQGRPSRPTLD